MNRKSTYYFASLLGLWAVIFFAGCNRYRLPTPPPVFTYTPTSSPTGSVTSTPTSTATSTTTVTHTATFTLTTTATFTPTPTSTFTVFFTTTATVTPTFTAPVTSTPTSTPTPTPTLAFSSATFTMTRTPTSTATPAGPIVGIAIAGNLDSTQRADLPGGVLDLGPSASALLPFASASLPVNGSFLQYVVYGGSGQAFEQIGDFLDPLQTSDGIHPYPMMMGGMNLAMAQSITTSAWMQGGAVPPACSTVKTVLDSQSTAHEITLLFYQVNDLGPGGVNTFPSPQVVYAWFAFETTGGQPPSNTNLIGGTGIIEAHPDDSLATQSLEPFLRGTGWFFWGDFLWFNPDGSLTSIGGLEAVSGIQAKARVYLPVAVGVPVSGFSDVLPVELNFGTAGILPTGQRDGLTCDPSACNLP